MAKVELKLKDLKGFFLSPGNIFWQQKSGATVLLSEKSNFLNLELIEKLSRAGHTLLIEDQMHLQMQQDFTDYFHRHQSELLVKEKMPWRFKLLQLFSGPLASSEISQFEVDQLGWSVFSSVDLAKARHYLDLDIDLFKRAMSIASSYTFSAFMLGYYDDKFLKKIYNETFESLMELKTTTPLHILKDQLEKMRTIKTLTEEDNKILESTYHLSKKKSLVLGERYDGSGLLQINKREMSDLELVMVALCDHYSVLDNTSASYFRELKEGRVLGDEKVFGVLKKCLFVKNDSPAQMSA